MKHINENQKNIEMAKINDMVDLEYDVYIEGGIYYGNVLIDCCEPHFHYSDNYNNPQKFSISVLIPNVNEWKENKELIIIDSLNNKLSWNGLRKEKDLLIEWLDKNNIDLPIYTNIHIIRYQWNTLNKDNKNVRQINII